MIFTFYSYKGGVGRSMALANAAAWLRMQGLRVAMIDWDLEAPGLESFFFESPTKLEEFASQVGLIDTLLSYKRIFPKLQKPLDEKKTLAEKIAVLDDSLRPLVARGLLERSPGHWRATPKGFRFLNDILVELLPDAEVVERIPGPMP